jgi:dihydroxy-acid dehydratase
MTAHQLRSRNWFGRNDLDGFVHRSWLKAEGFSNAVFDGRPVVGIANSWSELTNCNAHLRQVADAVKRGVWSAGGFPVEFPTISLGEVLMNPTTMLFRNLMAMDVEECLRAYPLDAAVLLSGCDKTTPAMLMGAAFADIRAVMVTGGPMLSGKWRAEELGSGSDAWRLWAERRAGRLTDEELCEAESCMSRSSGHCMVMGTASTMASVVEALGMTLPGNAAIPASDSRRLAMAEMAGRRAVEMALAGGPKPSQILTARAFDNAIRADMAIGGSTNAIIHLVAVAGRVGVPLPLKRFDELSKTTPFLVNLRPSGKYLMEDFFYAGGLPAVLKQSAASPHLLTHRGRAVVFEDHADLHKRVDDESVAIDENSVLVLKQVGPRGAPGMPEWGAAPIPARLLKRGVKDMVRISDARMSGTSYGTVVLHVAPESAIGGPLALVRDGDEIELDVPRRSLTLRVSDDELARRKAAWKPRAPHFTRGHGKLFLDHVLQANEGVDFDYLRGRPPRQIRGHRGPVAQLRRRPGKNSAGARSKTYRGRPGSRLAMTVSLFISCYLRVTIPWHRPCLNDGHEDSVDAAPGKRILEEQQVLAHRRGDRSSVRLGALRPQVRAGSSARSLLPPELLKNDS